MLGFVSGLQYSVWAFVAALANLVEAGVIDPTK